MSGGICLCGEFEPFYHVPAAVILVGERCRKYELLHAVWFLNFSTNLCGDSRPGLVHFEFGEIGHGTACDPAKGLIP